MAQIAKLRSISVIDPKEADLKRSIVTTWSIVNQKTGQIVEHSTTWQEGTELTCNNLEAIVGKTLLVKGWKSTFKNELSCKNAVASKLIDIISDPLEAETFLQLNNKGNYEVKFRRTTSTSFCCSIEKPEIYKVKRACNNHFVDPFERARKEVSSAFTLNHKR